MIGTASRQLCTLSAVAGSTPSRLPVTLDAMTPLAIAHLRRRGEGGGRGGRAELLSGEARRHAQPELHFTHCHAINRCTAGLPRPGAPTCTQTHPAPSCAHATRPVLPAHQAVPNAAMMTSNALPSPHMLQVQHCAGVGHGRSRPVSAPARGGGCQPITQPKQPLAAQLVCHPPGPVRRLQRPLG